MAGGVYCVAGYQPGACGTGQGQLGRPLSDGRCRAGPRRCDAFWDDRRKGVEPERGVWTMEKALMATALSS